MDALCGGALGKLGSTSGLDALLKMAEAAAPTAKASPAAQKAKASPATYSASSAKPSQPSAPASSSATPLQPSAPAASSASSATATSLQPRAKAKNPADDSDSEESSAGSELREASDASDVVEAAGASSDEDEDAADRPGALAKADPYMLPDDVEDLSYSEIAEIAGLGDLNYSQLRKRIEEAQPGGRPKRDYSTRPRGGAKRHLHSNVPPFKIPRGPKTDETPPTPPPVPVTTAPPPPPPPPPASPSPANIQLQPTAKAPQHIAEAWSSGLPRPPAPPGVPHTSTSGKSTAAQERALLFSLTLFYHVYVCKHCQLVCHRSKELLRLLSAACAVCN